MQINDIVKFDTIASSILGTGITGKVVSILPFEKAIRFSEKDLPTRNELVYASISEPNVPDVRLASFLEIKTFPNDAIVYFSKDWIVDTSVVILTKLPEVKLTISGTYDLEDIKSFLRLKNINYTIS